MTLPSSVRTGRGMGRSVSLVGKGRRGSSSSSFPTRELTAFRRGRGRIGHGGGYEAETGHVLGRAVDGVTRGRCQRAAWGGRPRASASRARSR